MAKKHKIFSHSGDLGDIIYYLPVMRELGGGVLNITELDPELPVRTRQNLLHSDKWKTLVGLLESQDYVKKVTADKDVISDYDGDEFRKLYLRAMKQDYSRSRMVNLVTWQCIPNQVNPKCQEKAWLDVEPEPVAKFVINRTERYQSPHFPWASVYDLLGQDSVFIGTKKEHQKFMTTHGPIEYHETPTLLDAAKVIKGSKCFIGNQSCMYAIAEGMKHNALLEPWPFNPNCLFKRPGVMVGFDYNQTITALNKIK